jgi:phosphoglucomutase
MSIQLKEDETDLREELVDKALSAMILSASGWRTVFAKNADEESAGTALSSSHKVIAAVAAKVFADYVKGKSNEKGGKRAIIIGMDTRPTGPAIADVMIRAFLSEGCEVRFASITAAPEIMAYARTGNAQGFVYISASHNPIGHNGLKFGLTDGGVLPGSEANILIDAFRSVLSAPNRIARAIALVKNAAPTSVAAVYGESGRIKAEALAAYLRFTKEVVSGTGDSAGQENFFRELKAGLEKRPLGIVADFNGSARTLSIDKAFLPELGVKFDFINGEAGKIAHRIVPEGESLRPCALFLETLHKSDPALLMGYVPDCDGDRGNLVIWDDKKQHVRALEAQEVFALSCVSELAHLVWSGELAFDAAGAPLNKAAIAVNDPTSLRIDRIAAAFRVPVFRAEVGEANVVTLARKLREQGYTVRILGEGSAGGNITHPSAVRDPIDTVFALLKMLTIRSEGGEKGKKGFFELWCSLSGQESLYKEDFTFADIIAALPAFTSTGSYTADALLRVKTGDHALLKNRYQTIFLREWETKKARMEALYGITGWNAAAYKGIEEKKNLTRFGEAGHGGLKITFHKGQGVQTAAIWMRGSATEPVFRIMADAEGADSPLERELIAWQRAMVEEADSEQ